MIIGIVLGISLLIFEIWFKYCVVNELKKNNVFSREIEHDLKNISRNETLKMIFDELKMFNQHDQSVKEAYSIINSAQGYLGLKNYDKVDEKIQKLQNILYQLYLKIDKSQT